MSGIATVLHTDRHTLVPTSAKHIEAVRESAGRDDAGEDQAARAVLSMIIAGLRRGMT